MPANPAKRSIMFLPHHSLLSMRPLGEWARIFEQLSGRPPTEVVLPAVELDGPTFPTEIEILDELDGKILGDWVGEARALPGIEKVWGTINATYPFLEGAEDLMVTDQFGITLDANVCIANPVIQELTDRLIADGLSQGLDGIALDITDIYPNSGSNVTNEIQDTCFCRHCTRQLAELGFDVRPDQFTGRKNPFRLVLKITETGTDNIPIRTEWLDERQAERLYEVSRAREFVRPDEATALSDAGLLLDYVDARRHAVARSVRRLAQVAKESGRATAVILGESNLDLTTMSDLATLHSEKAVDEYWLPEARVSLPTPAPTLCRFLTSRGTYNVNTYFETFTDGPVWLANRGPEFVIRQIAIRHRKTQGIRLTRGHALATNLSQEYAGFVGIPLTAEDFRETTRALLEKVLGPVVPRNQLMELTDVLAAGGLPGTTD